MVWWITWEIRFFSLKNLEKSNIIPVNQMFQVLIWEKLRLFEAMVWDKMDISHW
jgi:hypothetical protein